MTTEFERDNPVTNETSDKWGDWDATLGSAGFVRESVAEDGDLKWQFLDSDYLNALESRARLATEARRFVDEFVRRIEQGEVGLPGTAGTIVSQGKAWLSRYDQSTKREEVCICGHTYEAHLGGEIDGSTGISDVYDSNCGRCDCLGMEWR